MSPSRGGRRRAGASPPWPGELSQIYEVGLDILRTPDSIEAALHLYCSAYSRDMTRRLAELLGMCDVCAASRPRTEPSDLTLSLMLYTHRCYVSGRLDPAADRPKG